jgi:membrane fusion protein, multidrug efflux system
LTEQVQTSPPAAADPPPVAPTARSSSGSPARNTVRHTLGRLALPLFAVVVAFCFIALATLRFDAWTGNAAVQTTNDAYVRAETTRLSSRVAGEVLIQFDDNQPLLDRLLPGMSVVTNINTVEAATDGK